MFFNELAESIRSKIVQRIYQDILTSPFQNGIDSLLVGITEVQDWNVVGRDSATRPHMTQWRKNRFGNDPFTSAVEQFLIFDIHKQIGIQILGTTAFLKRVGMDAIKRAILGSLKSRAIRRTH